MLRNFCFFRKEWSSSIDTDAKAASTFRKQSNCKECFRVETNSNYVIDSGNSWPRLVFSSEGHWGFFFHESNVVQYRHFLQLSIWLGLSLISDPFSTVSLGRRQQWSLHVPSTVTVLTKSRTFELYTIDLHKSLLTLNVKHNLSKWYAGAKLFLAMEQHFSNRHDLLDNFGLTEYFIISGNHYYIGLKGVLVFGNIFRFLWIFFYNLSE